MFRSLFPCSGVNVLEFCALPGGLPTTVYHDPAKELWIVQRGVDYPGRSIYFVSEGGRDFFEHMETESCESDGARMVRMERLNVHPRHHWFSESLWRAMKRQPPVDLRKKRFVRTGERASLFEEVEGKEVRKSDSLALVALEDVMGVLGEGRYHEFNAHVLRERIAAGDLNAVLAYGLVYRSTGYARIDFPEEHLPEVVERAGREGRALAALCILAGMDDAAASDALHEYGDGWLASAARYYAMPLQILWQRARDGGPEALEAIRALAFDLDNALDYLVELSGFWNAKGAAGALRTVPIEGRRLGPGALKAFAEAGHPDAEGLLRRYDPTPYIDMANRHRHALEISRCDGLSDLGILVRHDNRRALEGLLSLHADGHFAARLMLKKLVEEGFLAGGVLKVVDPAPLAERAGEDPMAVMALYHLHEDGHPGALEILRGLAPVDGLLRLASNDYDAVGAIYFLDKAGNPGISQGIDSVSIEQWKERYHWRGQARIDGREAREVMAILAGLGHEAACRHERVAVPGRAVAAMATQGAVAELRRQGYDVETIAEAPSSIADEGPAARDDDPAGGEGEGIN